jgi:ribosomal protein S27AE
MASTQNLRELRTRWNRFRICSGAFIPIALFASVLPRPLSLVLIVMGLAVFAYAFIEQFALTFVRCPSCDSYFFAPRGKRWLGAWVWRSSCGKCGASLKRAA